MSVPLSYYGSPDPLPVRRELRAGPLTAVYEAGDLRYVRVGGVEVCRRWYAAVRDRNWGTVPGAISDEEILQSADGFRVAYTSIHRQGDVHFVWQAEIVGTPTGITFAFDGEAKSSFLRNRIGFCVLHPPETCAGRRVVLNGTDESAFPDLIAPKNPFHDLSALSHDLPGGGRATWTFDGDLFETEDQRNWTDASFKTFCTPLSRPFPVEAKPGDRVRQTVTLRLEGVASPAGPASVPGTAGVPPAHLHDSGASLWQLGPWRAGRPRSQGPTPESLDIDSAAGERAFVEVGLSIAGLGGKLSDRECELLRVLRPAHLRVELDLTSPAAADQLRRATADASAVGTRLELAVTVSDEVWAETKSLIENLYAVNPPLARVLAFHNREWATPARIVTPVVEAIARYDASVPVFVGTTANFTELNRGRPDPTTADGVCYSVQPQEHAFDNASLVECCAAVADTVRSARAFCGGKPIAVTPSTLRKRVNPYATGPWERPPPDPRQGSLFGAVWTLGTLKYLAEAGAASATFYETVGPRGVMDAGGVFPLFHVLADTTESAGAAVLKWVSSDPLRFDALALKTDSGPRLLLANMTAEPQEVSVNWPHPRAVVRTLDGTTFEFATTDPVAFRSRLGETVPTVGDRLTLSLKPYAYVRIDG